MAETRVALRVARALAVSAALAAPAVARPPTLQAEYEFRLRFEDLDTPAASDSLDRRYGVQHARLRLRSAARWERFSLHATLQGGATRGLPAAPAFGPGSAYLGANHGDRAPEGAALAEAFVRYRNERVEIAAGRLPFAEGSEFLTGTALLDETKQLRLAERLVGNWEWVNVGRRFQGATVGAGGPSHRATAFYLRPLAGGPGYDDAFAPLPDLAIAGVNWSLHRAATLRELRLFAIHYADGRAGARAAAGGEIDLTTAGASLLAGGPKKVALLWLAGQTGDWGRRGHQAWAAVADVGYSLADRPGKPALHIGLEQASGQGRSADHQTFFNLLPTNHKFYGSLDYFAFSNLRHGYLEARWSPRPGWKATAVARAFALAEARDAWYSGSGAFDETRLGYSSRPPARGGSFRSRSLGEEVDLEALWSVRQDLGLRFGAAYFRGGAAAREALPGASAGRILFLELVWKPQPLGSQEVR